MKPVNQSEAPNLLFIMPDQWRADFIGCNGFRAAATPNLDALAAEGVNYTCAVSPHPLCVPARTNLLTGMNPLKTGIMGNGTGLRPDWPQIGPPLWTELLGDAGYQTVAVGKMHFYPWDAMHGFHKRVIAEDKRWPNIRDDYSDYLHAKGLRKYHPAEDPEYATNKGAVCNRYEREDTADAFVARETCRLLEERDRARPFAMMVGFPSPHCPYDPPAGFLEKVNAELLPEPVRGDWTGNRKRYHEYFLEVHRRPWNRTDYEGWTDEQIQLTRLHYAALVAQLDAEIGRIIQTLRELGVLENTWILFASDHGDQLGDRRVVGKGLFYRQSIDIPLIVRPPGGLEKGHTCDDLVELGDITATLLAAAGVDIPALYDSRPLPGLGFDTQQREIVFGSIDAGFMAFDGRWKLTRYGFGFSELFDLQTDPYEQQNRIADPSVADQLLRLDQALTEYITTSLTICHQDKRLSRGREPTTWIELGERNWVRPYPVPLGSK